MKTSQARFIIALLTLLFSDATFPINQAKKVCGDKSATDKNCLHSTVSELNHGLSEVNAKTNRSVVPCPNGPSASTQSKVSCVNPAKRLCGEGHVNVIEKARTEFEFLAMALQARKRIDGDWSFFGICIDRIAKNKSIFCEKRQQQRTENELFTPERREKAEAIFDTAKNLSQQVLQKRLEVYRKLPNADQETIRQIERLILNIGTMKLTYGMKELQWNAAADALKNEVQLDGMIMAVDSNPTALLLILLHEIGHRTGPLISSMLPKPGKRDEYEVIPFSPHYPFKSEVECLEKTVSKKRDDSCFTKILEQASSLKAGSSKELALLDEIKKNLRINPYYYPQTAGGKMSCQPPQADEAQSDLFASEGFALYLQSPEIANPPKSTEDIVREGLGVFCDIYENKYLQVSGGFDSHPSAELRINEIFMRHPVIREAAGCAAEKPLGGAKHQQTYCTPEWLQTSR